MNINVSNTSYISSSLIDIFPPNVYVPFTLKYINLTKYMAMGSGYKFVNLVTALPCTNNK